ncbi:MAG TPA: hypothetical protein VIY49_09930 [Bryobacteraceae bacterium]
MSQFIGSGDITDANWAASLNTKLNEAAADRAAGSCGPAASIYNAFINEVSAQTGKKVSSFAPGVMIADAQYLIANCP